MAKITVYEWSRYELTHDQMTRSRRLGTLEAIERVCGEPDMTRHFEIDEADLDPTAAGMTPRDYKPRGLAEFQTQVTG
jgi:hypothetical protein